MSARTRAARKRWSVAAALILGMLAACTSTSLVNLWHDPQYPHQPLTNIIVVTMRKDPASRRIWEDGFARELKRHGIAATPSYEIFPNAVPDTAAMLDAVKSHGYDAMLLAHLSSDQTQTRWVPGYATVQPVWYGSPWFGHYVEYYHDMFAPGYYESERVVRYETEVWMTQGSGRLVWVGTTASINPTSSKSVNAEIADQIVPELVKQGVLAGH